LYLTKDARSRCEEKRSMGSYRYTCSFWMWGRKNNGL